ncbi:uncharacterized protein DNG_05166 [Cephalotrichum gorgonifer]|uniref:NB-ARC domain-containing protein n=1 Tax=Cephalotrichum gorgonifer TaxID=2041049 RepID=A0AAE8MZF1_9PEZI|nr:uncharacterized protein DNG_05166 [Cephalotrichum gorgonifer]
MPFPNTPHLPLLCSGRLIVDIPYSRQQSQRSAINIFDTMETSEDDGDLFYNLACDCEALFDAHLAQLKELHSPLASLSADYQQRFAIWTAHLGVFARRSQSLDTRLRNHSDVQDLVARLLDILRRSLQQLVQPIRVGGEIGATCVNDNEQDKARDAQNEALAAVEATLMRLNRLGVTIRQSSHGRIDIKVKTFAAGLDLGPFATASRAVVQTLYPHAHQALREYLDKTMTDRYVAMRFAKDRKVKLQSRRPAKERGPIPTISEGVEAVAPGWYPSDQLALGRVSASAELPKKPGSDSRSDLSTVDSKQLKQILSKTNNLEAPSKRRRGMSSVQVSQGNYPELPFQTEGNFITCEFCGKGIDKRDTNESDWRRHIDEDLKPYTCISEACPDSHPAYPTFREWFKHMVEDHSRRWHQRAFLTPAWVCAICDDDDLHGSYTSPEALHLHLTRSHGDKFSASSLQAISRQSGVVRPRRWNECLLCCATVDEVGASDKTEPPKRRKRQLRRGSDKILRTTVTTGHPNPPVEELGKGLEGDSDEPSDDSLGGTDKIMTSENAEMMARHIAAHLQTVMLFTIRLASLQDEQSSDPGDDVNSRSVDIGDSENPSQAKDARYTADTGSTADSDMPDTDDEIAQDVDALDYALIPDADVDFSGVRGQYDDLRDDEDKFLQSLFASGAHQSYRKEEQDDLSDPGDDVNKPPETPPQPFASIPFCRDPDFVNREDILDQMDRWYSVPVGRVALVGLGGVGKSQLAIEFAHRIAEARSDVWMFWIYAGKQAHVEEGFRTIADTVKLAGRSRPKADIPLLVQNWLSNERNGRWIIILDGADDYEVFYGASEAGRDRPLATYLPQSRNGSIIITTRNKDLAWRLTGNRENIIEIGPMVQTDALTLLQKKLGLISDVGAVDLVEVLDRVPLAISQAAAYIQARAPRSSVENLMPEGT